MSTNAKSGHDRDAAEKRKVKKDKKNDADSTTATGGVKKESALARVQEIADAGVARNTKDRTRESVPYPKLPNGAANPEYTDYLTDYPEIASQLYGVYSFISPEREIRRREMFMFEKFVRQWSYSTSVTAFSEFIHFLSMKHGLQLEQLKTDLTDFISDKTNQIGSLNVTDDFLGYVETNYKKLDEQYEAENPFETSVRGFVHLGNFPTHEAASKRSVQIRELHPEHNVLVSRNFKWIPLDPDLYKLPEIDYLEPELNQLHKEKLMNQAKAKAEFDKRVYEAKRKAIEENIAKAQKYGGKVSQTMDEAGNLVRSFNPEIDTINRDPAPEIKSDASTMDASTTL
jgi:hypothetical protein